MRLFETNENEAKMPHCKIYNPMMELTTVRARERVCTYGVLVAFGLRANDAKCDGYSEWGMRGWSVLGSVLLMSSGVFDWSLLIMARCIDSKACALFPYIEYKKTDITGLGTVVPGSVG